MHAPSDDKHHNAQARLMSRFVEHAKHQVGAAALSILSINGADLLWWHVGPCLFAGHVRDGIFSAIDADKHRAELAGKQFLRRLLMVMEPMLARMMEEAEGIAMPPGTNESDRHRLAGILAASRPNEERSRSMESLLPEFIPRAPVLASYLASLLALEAIEGRLRQEEQSGLRGEEYDAMLEALAKLGLIESLVRVSARGDGTSCELTFAASDGYATIVREGCHWIEARRLVPWLAEMKRHDNEMALPCFIAEYLNQWSLQPNAAFACARYGDSSGGDIDVAIPTLDLGIEVKLSRRPTNAHDGKIGNLAKDLCAQLPRYFEVGCREVVVLSNLPQAMLAEVPSSLGTMSPQFSVEAVRFVSTHELTAFLEELVARLDEHRSKQLGRHLEARAQRARTSRGSAGSNDGSDSSERGGDQPEPKKP